MAVYFDPRLTSGGGNLANAVGMWNTFFGPQSKMNAAQLKQTQQATDIAGEEEKRAKGLYGPTLDQANSAAAAAKAQAESINLDLATRKAAAAALNAAPASLWKPTTAMSPDEFSQWQGLHRQNGAANPDWNKLGSAWNAGMATLHGKVALPEGGIPTQFSFDSGTGNTTTGGAVIPNLGDLGSTFGGVKPPGQAPGAAPVTAVPSEAAQPGAASAAPGIPSLADLMPVAVNPFLRGAMEWGLDTQNKIATQQEKGQNLAKGSRELEFGSPEQQKQEQEFARSAALSSHILDDWYKTVDKYGNYESTSALSPFSNNEAAAKLNALPTQFSEAFNKVTNPGAVLREGLVHLNKEFNIPMPGNVLTAAGTDTGVTKAAINNTKSMLADYVRQYENQPSTRTPVRGLSPHVRKMVGETKFGKPDDKIFAPEEGINQFQTEFKDAQEFQKARAEGKVQPNQSVFIGGVLHVPTAAGWMPQSQLGQTNSPALPPVAPPLTATNGIPAGAVASQMNRSVRLPNLPISLY